MIALVLAMLPACGAVKALTNPAAAEGLNEPATMGVVVRRAELSRAISEQVERVTSKTPLDRRVRQAMLLDTAKAEPRLRQVAGSPIYAGMPFRVLPAEAWHSSLSEACAEDPKPTPLINRLGDKTARDYAGVFEHLERIAKLEAEVTEAENRAEAEGLPEADRVAYQARAQQLQARIDALEASFDAKQEALLASVKAAAGRATAADKAVMRPIVLGLSSAVTEAKNANAAAVARYPFVVPTLTTDLQDAAKRFAADVVDEQIGHRPNMSGLQPQIAMKDGKVALTLNGIPVEKIGDVDSGELLVETTKRTQGYAVFALALLGFASETQTRLDFQGELFDAWLEGLGPGTAAPDLHAVRVTGQQAAPTIDSDEPRAPRDPRSPGGLSLLACTPRGGPAGDASVTAEDSGGDSDADDPSGSTPLPPMPQHGAAASSSSEKTLAYVLGGIGIAGVATGTVTLILGLGQQGVGDDNCNDSLQLCNQRGFDANETARTYGVISTVGFLVGAAGLGASAYLFLASSPSSAETAITTRLEPNGASAALRHRF